MNTNLQLVPFAEGDILTIHDGANAFVVIPTVVKNIGLDWEPQRKRIERHPVMAETTSIMEVVTTSGPKPTTVMTLEGFHTFLVTLHPDRISDPAIRERILAYQRRAFRAVFEHFHGPIRIASTRPAPVSELLRVGNALKRERNPRIRAELWARYDQVTDSWGLPRGEHTGIGFADPDRGELLGQFWNALFSIEEAGLPINHSRRNHLYALSLPELRRLFAELGVPLEIDSSLMSALRQSLAPAFLGDKTVNCRDGKSRHCWIFSLAGVEKGLREVHTLGAADASEGEEDV